MRKKLKLSVLFLALIMLAGNFTAAAQGLYSLQGRVISTDDSQPIDLAMVKLNTQDWATTNENGAFIIKGLRPGRYTYEVSYLGFETATGEFEIKNSNVTNLTIKMSPLTLALKEVVVTAQEGRLGATSNIGQAAIQHLQAKSLEDMLQLLPGAVTKNPDLTNAGQATIREIDAGDNANNALGTSIVIDGAPLSNDANMQVFSTARSGNNSSVQQNTMNNQTTAGRGVDLRQISPDNIESLQVIRGIPSVEYGNLTSGVVVVKTKAGVMPWEAAVKVDPNSKLGSIAKGFRLGTNGGFMNVAAEYTHSVSDRRRSYLGYDRVTGNLSYSTTFMQTSKPLTFNVKATYYKNLSDTKSDEDLLAGEYYKNNDEGIRLGINGMWRLNTKAISSLNYSASFQYSHQEDIYNRTVGSGVVPYSHSYTPGEMEVSFLPAQYMCNYKLDGKPITAFVQLMANRMLSFSKGSSNFKLGLEYNLTANHGGGLMYNQDYPPMQGEGQMVRPRSYSSVPAMNTFAGFIENMTELNLGATQLTVQPGVRLSHLTVDKEQALRGGITVADPRVNASWKFLTPENNSVFRSFALTGGYGIASKMPTMAYLYPTPAYFDFVNYNSYIAFEDPRNIAVMTTAVVPNTANADLKPARAHKWEIGLSAQAGQFSGFITFFKERTINEFGYTTRPISVNYNRYVIPTEDQSSGTIPTYNGSTVQYTTADGVTKDALVYQQREIRTYQSPSNDIRTDKHGIEYSLNLGRINPLSTDLIVDGAWFWIKRRDMGYQFESSKPVAGIDPTTGITTFNSYLALLPAGYGTIRSRFNSNFRFITHIPAIKLIVSTTVQVVWQESLRNIWEDSDGTPCYKLVDNNNGTKMFQVDPIGYYDKDLAYHTWDASAVERPDELTYTITNQNYYNTQKYPVTCQLNFKITKQIKNFLDISVVANNFLKFSNEYRQNMIGGYKELYSPMYFGAELKARF